MMLFFVIFGLVAMVSGTPTDICGQTFQVPSGESRTISYIFRDGQTYPGNSNCVFHLRGPGTNGLRITFSEFDIEKHGSCNFDYLQVFDGETTNSNAIRKLCGYTVPVPVETTTNTATLRFASDKTVHKTGFILEFSAKSADQFSGHCAPTFTDTSGSLKSPFFPNNYPNRVNCTYEIAPSTGDQILIQFPTFLLERSSYCVMDYVTISTRNQQIGGKLCGDLGGNAYLIPSSNAIINFVSDRSSTRKGFELTYNVISTCADLDSVCIDGCQVGDDNFLECICREGFTNLKGEAQCKDVDECKTSNGGCADHCTNTIGSFVCSCNRKGFFLSHDGRNCTDRTCAVNNAGCEHGCSLSGNGRYFCTCNKGYLIDTNGHNCTDIDECTSTKYKHGCEQKCNNEPGSYFCACQGGYTLSSNQRTCNDVDECLIHRDFCEHNCHNFPGGWSCSCYPGYQLNPSDPHGCIDIDECADEVIPDHCEDCSNYEGGFSCTTCSPGYVLNDNATLCLDINECNENNGGCQQECMNTPGTFNCNCFRGQVLVEGTNTGECRDINECTPNDGRGPCEHYCENSIGSFRCHCLDGYDLQTGSGTVCQDIDECADRNGGCHQKCNNNKGSFFCSCFPGYWMTYGQCNDVDECLEDKPCNTEIGATCTNSVGSFHCVCPSGYTVLNNTICLDVDECANSTYGPTHGCRQQCVNTPGSFHCACYDGFHDVGNNMCVDLNECSTSICEHPDLCVNTIGSFQCNCPPGYFLLGDGHNCNDVNECEGSSVRCQQICINEIGNYRCSCQDGYELNDDNHTCADINECQRNTSKCSDGCINIDGGYYCYCHQGFHFSANDNFTCHDINECDTDNGGCHHVCTNSPGSFACGCRDGYLADDHMCHDINECDTNNGNCSQTCKNFNGTYSCECEPDFKLGDDKHTCSHCPSCEMFEEVVADLAVLKPLPTVFQQLVDANMQLSATVALLKADVESMKRRISTLEQPVHF